MPQQRDSKAAARGLARRPSRPLSYPTTRYAIRTTKVGRGGVDPLLNRGQMPSRGVSKWCESFKFSRPGSGIPTNSDIKPLAQG